MDFTDYTLLVSEEPAHLEACENQDAELPCICLELLGIQEDMRNEARIEDMLLEGIRL